jgi:malonyl-CoA O-methyltransferase
MTIDKVRVARRFNRHARTYDDHARVQADMAELVMRSVRMLEPPPSRVLELGSGTGRLTALLAESLTAAMVDAVDIAENMVSAARERLAQSAQVRFSVADVEEEEWGSARFDLIVSSAAIQWLSSVEQTFGRLTRALSSGGRMIHATFGPRTFEELFSVFADVEAERGLPPRTRGLSPPTAEAWERLLTGLGLEDVRVSASLVRPTYASCRACLADVRGTGASYSPSGRSEIAVLTEVMHRYDRQFRVAGGVVATYEVIELSGTAP